jgi:hypothetical protein
VPASRGGTRDLYLRGGMEGQNSKKKIIWGGQKLNFIGIYNFFFFVFWGTPWALGGPGSP